MTKSLSGQADHVPAADTVTLYRSRLPLNNS